jgi:adenylate cyclase
MPMVIDPVCGMRIDSEDAAASALHDGTSYYFCARACRDLFLADPSAAPWDRDMLSEEEVARRATTSVERVRQLVTAGILRPHGESFDRSDVMQVRVLADLEAKGIPAEAVAAGVASGHLRLGYLESGGRSFPRGERTLADLAGELAVGVETLQRLYVAFGLPRPDADEPVRLEDLPVLTAIPVFFGAGVDEGQLLRAVRVWGESARRVAQFQSHYLHHVVERHFRERGMGDNEAFEAAIREVGLRVGHSGEDMLAWLFRRHSERYLIAHQVEHVETALEEAGIRRRLARGVPAAVFADLSGFTRLTEEAGDERAAHVALTLAEAVSTVASEFRGDVVKMLGDGVYLHFADPHDAVRASLSLVGDTGRYGLPPAHIGVNAGPMIYDEGDYFGRTVNVAARLAGEASPHQVLVGEDAAAVVHPEGFRLVEVGPVSLKGIAQPVMAFEARAG